MIKANESMMLDQMDVNDRDGATVVYLRTTLNEAEVEKRLAVARDFRPAGNNC